MEARNKYFTSLFRQISGKGLGLSLYNSKKFLWEINMGCQKKSLKFSFIGEPGRFLKIGFFDNFFSA